MKSKLFMILYHSPVKIRNRCECIQRPIRSKHAHENIVVGEITGEMYSLLSKAGYQILYKMTPCTDRKFLI